ncbi:MAG TPA: FHA domain-containing protein [Bacteriovoracaceae bacterium]|nr:FHA domain-containing protein [Bacteriovoracaceae bacterium]
MRIEVIVGNEEPKIFPLSKTKIALGSGETCDIELRASGISRKHIIILNEDDSYYVVDQGSTNGSFINEQRLVPGRKVEFTSFFPVRLGDSVLLNLIGDFESNDFIQESLKDLSTLTPAQDKNQQTTKVFSLKELQSTKTENLVRKRNELIVQKRSQARVGPAVNRTRSDKSRMTGVQLLAILIVGIGAYYNFFAPKEEAYVAPPVSVVGEEKALPALKKTDEQLPAAAEVPEVPERKPPVLASGLNTLDPTDLTSRDALSGLLDDIKCTLDTEIYFCDLIPGAKTNPWGAAQVGTMVNVLIDGTTYLNLARKLLVKPDLPEEMVQYEEEIKLVASVFFLHEALPAKLNWDLLKDKKLTFGLFDVTSERTGLDTVMAMKPEALKEIKEKLTQSLVDDIKHEGAASLKWLKDLMNVY